MQNSFNWVDLATLLILLVYALDGMAKGLIISVFKTVGFFIAIYGARILAPLAAGVLSGNVAINNSLHKYFESGLSANSSTMYVSNIVSPGGKAGDSLTSLFITIGAFIIAFLLIKLLISIIANTLNITAKLPVIKQFNKIGGLFFGVVKGILILYILFAVFILVTPLISASSPLMAAVDSSVSASYFYKNNLIVQWLSIIFGK
jgi:uncharacterized membrane protein required for colicin V production